MYYCDIKDGLIINYTDNEDIARFNNWTSTIDYVPIHYKDLIYTQEKFAEIQATQEYK